MPSQPLNSLPGGVDVFVDTNILVYGLSGQSSQCAGFLNRCSLQEVCGVTSYEVVAEANHRFMLAEAYARGFITRPSAQALRRKRDVIPMLREYRIRTDRILNMNLLFLPTDESILRLAQLEQATSAVLTNDSIILACMRAYGIAAIASHDEDFEGITGITLFRPDDL